MIKFSYDYLYVWILTLLAGHLQSNFCHAQGFANNNIIDTVGLTNSTKSDYSQYLFGLPPMKINPAWAIPGVQPDDDFETWMPPIEYTKTFPYYLSGFDREGYPIWIAEYGKYDVRKYVVADRKTQDIFEKFQRQACYVAIKSRLLNVSKDQPPLTRHSFIIDFEGSEQLATPAVLEYGVKLIRKYRRYFEKNMHKMVVLNVNFVAETIFNVVRPIFGRLLHRIESYGTNKAIYEPRLHEIFGKDQIPEWYGGSKEHKPVYIYG